MGFLESERGMRRIKGYAQLPALIAKLGSVAIRI
jgi:hypothetical protein